MRHHGATAGVPRADLPVVALVGRPNVGKSTFLGRASGRYAESANAPGTTVGLERRVVTSRHGEALLVDLPGTHSLVDTSAGIEPFWRLLLGSRPDALLVIADAGDLERHLPLALGCRDTGIPLVVALNLADEAADAGIRIDTGRLSQLLAAPVHLTVGRSGEGVGAAVSQAIDLAAAGRAARAAGRFIHRAIPASIYPPAVETSIRQVGLRLRGGSSLGAAAFDPVGIGRFVGDSAIAPLGGASIELADVLEPLRWHVAARWARLVEERSDVAEPRRERLARLAVTPIPGIPLFVAVALGTLGAMMAVGGALAALLASAWSATVSPFLAAAVPQVVPLPAVAGALLWALDGGIIAMLSVGIPYVLTFYVLLALLEDSGYLTTAAVLVDRLLNALGLPGRAAIPLLAATGCNVPAIYGTRVLATKRQRLLASFLVTLTPCSARSAVVVAALAPFAGPAVALSAFGVIAAITVAAGVAANALVPGHQPPTVLELAPLRRPVAALVARKAWDRFRSFVITATPIMLVGSFALGLVHELGLIRPLESAIAPFVTGWLGLPPVVGIAVGFAFLRKELALQLLVVLAVAELGPHAASLGAFLSPGQLFVYAIVTAVSVPCVATLATLAAELGRREAITISAATLGVALVAGGVIARVVGVA